MSSFYLLPTATFTDATGNQFTAPKYYDTDLVGIPFGFIPFGVEGCGLLSLDQPNADLSAETDVFTFPSDLTQTLAPVIVSTTMAFNNLNPNIPTSWMTSGMTFGQVLRQLAQIFLATQFAEGDAGTGGASIFVAQQQGQGLKSGGTVNQTPSSSLQAIPAGVFDFTQANPSDSVSDTLVAISQQFTDPIQMGQGAI